MKFHEHACISQNGVNSHTRSINTDAFTQINATCTVTPTFAQTPTSLLASTCIVDSLLGERYRMVTSRQSCARFIRRYSRSPVGLALRYLENVSGCCIYLYVHVVPLSLLSVASKVEHLSIENHTFCTHRIHVCYKATEFLLYYLYYSDRASLTDDI